jgi:hypothetical protein
MHADHKHRLTRTRRTQKHTHLTRRQIERDVFPDSLAPEELRQPLNVNTDAHVIPFAVLVLCAHRLDAAVCADAGPAASTLVARRKRSAATLL